LLSSFPYQFIVVAETRFSRQRDDIVRNMERRRMMLEKMIAESKDKVARHLAGEQVFGDDEVCSASQLK
jgi:hypothetical protein